MTTTIQIPEKHIKIINLLANGLTKKEVSTEMKLGYKNIERIVGNLLEQFAAKNTTHLVHVLWQSHPDFFKL